MAAEILEAPPPGALGAVVALHGAYYARDWKLMLPFEALVAAELGAFAGALPHPDCRLWVACAAGEVVGAVAIDGRTRPTARLRWFIVAEGHRGGLGARLLERALDFCRTRGFGDVWLATFAGLHAARRLYERAGFVLEHEEVWSGWGTEVLEQRFRLTLG
jgi:GNAT superfamily N-acetyltransferase